MSWSASGTIEVADGEVKTDNLFWSPNKESMEKGPLEQAEFLRDVVSELARLGLIDGWYSLSLVGHYPVENEVTINQRKTVSMSFSAIEAPATTETNTFTG